MLAMQKNEKSNPKRPSRAKAEVNSRRVSHSRATCLASFYFLRCISSCPFSAIDHLDLLNTELCFPRPAPTLHTTHRHTYTRKQWYTVHVCFVLSSMTYNVLCTHCRVCVCVCLFCALTHHSPLSLSLSLSRVLTVKHPTSPCISSAQGLHARHGKTCTFLSVLGGGEGE